MRVLIQRVKKASVIVEGQPYGHIGQGLVLFVGFCQGDDERSVEKVVSKLDGLRIFEDEAGKTNVAIQEVSRQLLSISQFTLYASMKKGKRPSYDQVMQPLQADALYQSFNEALRVRGYEVQTGVFQSNMEVALVNDGPFTILLESEEL
ncbi:MAG: D-aminoacyl-tRNA deacylase [Erysipelotrichaceae bacterium]